MKTEVLDLTEQNFDETINSGVTLVDFWAPWCGPCKMQVPILEKVVGKIDGKATIAKLNVDESSEVAGKYGVRSIPTLIIFKDGEIVQQFVGLQSEPQLISAIEQALEG